MALDLDTLKSSLKSGLKTIMTERSNASATMSDDADPNDIIEDVADSMADVIANAVSAYIQSGDIYVGPDNVTVSAPTSGGPCTVTAAGAAKMV